MEKIKNFFKKIRGKEEAEEEEEENLVELLYEKRMKKFESQN